LVSDELIGKQSGANAINGGMNNGASANKSDEEIDNEEDK